MASPNPQPHLEMPQSQVAETRSFLTSLLNKQMRLYTTDDRMFAGDFKCTDNVRPLRLLCIYVPSRISQAYAAMICRTAISSSRAPTSIASHRAPPSKPLLPLVA